MHDKTKKELIDWGKILFESRHLQGTGGNISVRLKEGGNLFLITPSGMDYIALEPDDIVLCDLDGGKVEGKRRPSIETSLHSAIYRARDDVDAIIHSHSLYSKGLSMARKPLPVVEAGLTLIGNPIEVTDYGNPGSEKLARSALEKLGNNGAVLLANHGLVAVAKDMKKAFGIVEKVEFAIQAYMIAKIFGEPFIIPDHECAALLDFVKGNYGQA